MAETTSTQLASSQPLQREKKKKSKHLLPTYRFELKLTEENNEFSYAELVKEARRVREKGNGPLSHDNNDEDDDHQKLQEIARQFEEKYNPKLGRKKKKKKRAHTDEDYIDKGMGYDETDSFIDNEEAYDELVPSTITTEYGGFYINKGNLEFKNVTEIVNKDCDLPGKLKPKHDLGKEKVLTGDETPKKKGRKPLNDHTRALTKNRKKPQITVADMLQLHKANLQRLKHEGMLQTEQIPIVVEREIEVDGEYLSSDQGNQQQDNDDNDDDDDDDDGDGKLVIVESLPNQPSTICEAIECVIKASVDDSNGSCGLLTSSSEGEDVKCFSDNAEVPKLPNNLPADLEDLLRKLKKVSHQSAEGKCKFFTEDVNQLLLNVELKSQALTSIQRSIIYAHLASFLPCTKETLIKRAKKLRLDQEDGKLREPIQRLKQSIAFVMPHMIEKYTTILKETGEKEVDKNGIFTKDSEGEDSQEGSEKKFPRLPKKRFEWDHTTRKNLCDVVRIKLKCYEVSKTRIQSAEEYLKHFLEAEVKKLWPPGWMQSRILFRESRAAHFYITNRPKKQILLTKKGLISSSNSSAQQSQITFGVSQEFECDQNISDKSVPSVSKIELLDKNENNLFNSKASTHLEEKTAEFSKLLCYPIKTTDENSNIKTLDLLKGISSAPTSQSIINSVSEISSSIGLSKGDNFVSKSINQNVEPVCPTKISDFNTFGEGASDMLARIICASLADFPYAGSSKVETAPTSSATVVSLNSTGYKQRTSTSKLVDDVYSSAKRLDHTKQSGAKITEINKKQSPEMKKLNTISSFHNFSSLGINLEYLSNPKHITSSKSNEVKIKNFAAETNAIDLKLNDSVIPHARQFAEAFERSSDTSRKATELKSLNLHAQPSFLTQINTHHQTEHAKVSSRSANTSTQKIGFDFAKYSTAATSHSTSNVLHNEPSPRFSPKHSIDQCNPIADTIRGAATLEGMKGFPFPLYALPVPPPAHSNSFPPAPTPSRHRNSGRLVHRLRGLYLYPGSRGASASKSESINQNSPKSSNLLPSDQKTYSVPGSFNKSSPSQNSKTTYNVLLRRSPPVHIPRVVTSPDHNYHTPVLNLSPSPAHSMPHIERVSSPYSGSHSPLNSRSSPSLLPAHTNKSLLTNQDVNYSTPVMVTHTVSPMVQQTGIKSITPSASPVMSPLNTDAGNLRSDLSSALND